MAAQKKESLMVTPVVTEILPPWRRETTSRLPRDAAQATQRDLVVASLLAEGVQRDVYPRREARGTFR
jgi:hypothetical protein